MRRFALPIFFLLSVAACGDLDPYRRDGMWQPEGTAYGNLAAEVSNPHDLIEGRGMDGASGDRAARPIQILAKQGPGGAPSLSGSAGGFTAGSGGGSGGTSGGVSAGSGGSSTGGGS